MKTLLEESNKGILFVTLLVLTSFAFSDVSARSKDVVGTKIRVESRDQGQDLPFPQQRVHRMAEVNACMTNWAIMGSWMRDPYHMESPGGCFMDNPDSEAIAPSFEFPAGSGLEHLFMGGVWIGAIIDDTVYTSVGCDGWQWIYEMWPDKEPQGAIVEKSAIPEAPCYSPDAISHQDVIAVYADTSSDIPLSPQQQDRFDNRPHRPLNAKINQRSYSWNIPGFDKFIIAQYAIINVGVKKLGDVFLGFYMDADIMHIDETPYEPYGPLDDITGFLHIYEGDTTNIAWTADNDGHGDMDGGMWADRFTDKSPRHAVGLRVLDFPNPNMQISYNWWISNMAGLPRDWGPWLAENQQVWETINPYGSGGYFPDSVLGTPGGDVSKYFIMSNGELDYDQIFSCVDHAPQGWLPPNEICDELAYGTDTRFLLSLGPFDELSPGESLVCVLAYVIGETLHVDPNNGQNLPDNPDAFYANLDFSSLVQNALIAQELYDDNFLVFFPGDVTGDQQVNIADAICLINYLFLSGSPPSPLKVGDVNRDCVVDVEDVVYLMNYLFLNGPRPQVGCA